MWRWTHFILATQFQQNNYLHLCLSFGGSTKSDSISVSKFVAEQTDSLVSRAHNFDFSIQKLSSDTTPIPIESISEKCSVSLWKSYFVCVCVFDNEQERYIFCVFVFDAHNTNSFRKERKCQPLFSCLLLHFIGFRWVNRWMNRNDNGQNIIFFLRVFQNSNMLTKQTNTYALNCHGNKYNFLYISTSIRSLSWA